MMNVFRCGLTAAAVLVCSAGAMGAQWQASSSTSGATSSNSNTDETQRILSGLGLSAFQRPSVQLQPDDTVPGRWIANVDLGQGPTRLVLDPYSVRAPGFKVVVTDDSGAAEVAPPPITTFRGTVESSGDLVAASIQDGKLSAAIRPVAGGGGEAMFIQPLSDAGIDAAADQYVLYRQSDVVNGDWRCADEPECPDCHSTTMSLRDTPPIEADCIRTVEMLFDTDYPFFQAHASAAATVTDVEGIANQCDVIYRRDVGIAWTVSQVNVRSTAAADPYNTLGLTSVDPGTILNLVGTTWGGVSTPSRDLVHLMTGRDLTSSTIGIAWVGVVCRSNSNTGVSQSLFTTNLSMRTSVTAHEVGHNFGSSHDTSGSYIMAPAVGPGLIMQFSPASISAITSYVSGNGTCLTSAGPTAATDAATTQAGAFVLIDVLANDASGCGYTLSISLPSGSTTTGGGTVAISTGTGPGGRNQIRYTPPTTVPAAGINDTFTYRLTESTSNLSVTGTVGVSVTNSTPVTCTGDFNNSGAVSVQDIFDFLGAYFANTTAGDFNHSGSTSVQDIFDFLGAYFTPCP